MEERWAPAVCRQNYLSLTRFLFRDPATSRLLFLPFSLPCTAWLPAGLRLLTRNFPARGRADSAWQNPVPCEPGRRIPVCPRGDGIFRGLLRRLLLIY